MKQIMLNIKTTVCKNKMELKVIENYGNHQERQKKLARMKGQKKMNTFVVK